MNPPRIALILLAGLSLVAARPARAQTTGPATRPASGPVAAVPTSQQSSDQMLDTMLKPPPSVAGGARPLVSPNDPLAVDRTSGAGAVKPDAPPVVVLREGTYLVDRVGRLTRSADGTQAQFMFAADGKAMRDPPMVILPNSKLSAMEGANTGSNRDLKFRVTGVVTEYRGRNYLLLEKVLVVPDVVERQF